MPVYANIHFKAATVKSNCEWASTGQGLERIAWITSLPTPDNHGRKARTKESLNDVCFPTFLSSPPFDLPKGCFIFQLQYRKGKPSPTVLTLGNAAQEEGDHLQHHLQSHRLPQPHLLGNKAQQFHRGQSQPDSTRIQGSTWPASDQSVTVCL